MRIKSASILEPNLTLAIRTFSFRQSNGKLAGLLYNLNLAPGGEA